MKLFDYYCPTCDEVEERFVKTPDDVVTCNKCSTVMEKRLSMPAFILKGQGFYSSGTYPKSREGPKLDQDLLRLSDAELNYECGISPDVSC